MMPRRCSQPAGSIGMAQNSTGFSEGGRMECTGTVERVIIETAIQCNYAKT
jgi:hypothetical protein